MDRELLVEIWIGEESLLGNEPLHRNKFGLTPVVPFGRALIEPLVSSVSGAYISLGPGQKMG